MVEALPILKTRDLIPMIEEQRIVLSPAVPESRSAPPLFRSLGTLAEAIVAMFGDSCEVVVHDLSDRSNLDRTIVYVAGNLTGRRVGGPPTDVLLRKLRSEDLLNDFMVYGSTTRDGRILKSSTTFIRNDLGQVVGAFCVNLDITRMQAARAVLDGICAINSGSTKLDSPEVFGSAVNETLDAMIDEAIHHAGKLVEHMDKDGKVGVVRYLEARGVFLIRRAVDQIARRLGVSRYTVYNYLNEVRSG